MAIGDGSEEAADSRVQLGKVASRRRDEVERARAQEERPAGGGARARRARLREHLNDGAQVRVAGEGERARGEAWRCEASVAMREGARSVGRARASCERATLP